MLRGFLGGRGPGSKKSSAASEAMRAKMGGGQPKSQKERLDAMVQQYADNFIKARARSAAAANGGKGGEVELTKNMKQMMMILAHKQLKKEMKAEKKAAYEAAKAIKKEKAEKIRVKVMAQQEQDRKNAEYAAAQNPNNKGYWFGSTEE